MSEQPAAAPPRPGAGAQGKKYAGLSRNQWFIVGGVFVGVLGYLLWKRHQASSAAASPAAPANQGSNECTDQNGNPVDCNEQFAQELAALQNQLDQAGAASGAGGSTGGWGGGTTGTGTGTGTDTGTTTGMSGSSTTGTTTTATPATSTGSTGTAAAAPKTAGAITGLRASNVTKTSFTASWRAAANASQGYSYVVRNLASHTQQTAGRTNGTSVTVSGLKSGVDYNFGIQALPGGLGDNIHVRTT